MSVLKIRLLGCTSIKQDGTLLEMDTRKAMALLAYLLVTGSAHNRDSLATLLWPNSDQTSARGALRRTLSSLRKAIGEEALQTGRDIVSIEPNSELECDAVDFRRILSEVHRHQHHENSVCSRCMTLLQQAIDIYQGEFLAGFSLRDSLIFDNWQFSETEQFRREYASALVSLMEFHSIAGQYELATDSCRQWLALDPLNETAHRELMLLYAYSGQREAALRQYRECVRILENEIGVPPLEETTILYKEIKLNRIKPRDPVTDPYHHKDVKPQAPSFPIEQFVPDDSRQNGVVSGYRWQESLVPRIPLVGRENELDELLTRYHGIKADGRLAALVGEAGIGKTRLGEEFINTLSLKGAHSLAWRCYEGEQELAYSLFSSLLRAGIESNSGYEWWKDIPLYSLAETARLIPEIAEIVPDVKHIPPVDGPGAQTRFFTGVRDVLFKLVVQGEMSGPGILFLDDLHWIDSASLDLFTFMTRRMKGHPVFILCTWEDVRSETTTRLRSMIGSFQRENIAVLIPLQRLTGEETVLLIDTAIPLLLDPESDLNQRKEIDSRWLERLRTDSDGNPFILTAYLHMLARGRRSSMEYDPAPPESVRDLLMTRLNLVSSTARQILQTAALTGRSFDFQILVESSGRGEEETVTAIEELLSRGLVRETRSLSNHRIAYDFSHEIMRQMVCEEISMARSRLLNRRIAETMEKNLTGRNIQSAMEEIPHVIDPVNGVIPENRNNNQMTGHPSYQSTGQIAGQIARHYLQAGEVSKAAQFMYQAGLHEQSLYANKDAMLHLSNALALGYPDRFNVYLAMGDLQVLEGGYPEAIRSFQAAAAQEEPEDEQGNCMAQVEWKIGQVYGRMGEWQQALDQYLTALNCLRGDGGSLRIHINIDRGLALYRLGRFLEAQDMAEELLKIARDMGDTLALAQAHNLLGVLLRSRNELEMAMEHLVASLELAEELAEPAVMVAALNNLALAYQNAGDFSASESLVVQALVICTQQGDRHREAALRNHLADLLQLQGKKEEAMDQLLLAVAILTEIGDSIGEWQPEIWKLVEW